MVFRRLSGVIYPSIYVEMLNVYSNEYGAHGASGDDRME